MKRKIKNTLAILLAILFALTLSGAVAGADSVSTTDNVASQNISPVWSKWEDLGGDLTEGVAVSSWAPGRLDCFSVGPNRTLQHKLYDGSWHGWEELGGEL